MQLINVLTGTRVQVYNTVSAYLKFLNVPYCNVNT